MALPAWRCGAALVELPRRAPPSGPQAEGNLARAVERLGHLRATGAPAQVIRGAEVDWFGAEETVVLVRAAEEGKMEAVYQACMPAEVQSFRIGRWAFVGWPGEVFTDYALAVKRAAPDTFIISLANGELQGYIVTDEAAREGGYEASCAAFAPQSGQVLVETTLALLSDRRGVCAGRRRLRKITFQEEAVSPMRFLQIGLGSMGKRRVRCVQALHAGESIGVDPRADRRAEAERLYGIRTVPTFEEGLATNPDAVIISTPPDQHIAYAVAALAAGKPCFAEETVMLDPAALDPLLAAIRPGVPLAAPSCTMRFHPAVREIQRILEGGELGRPLSFMASCVSYLPDWHPWERIQDFYVASRVRAGAGARW